MFDFSNLSNKTFLKLIHAIFHSSVFDLLGFIIDKKQIIQYYTINNLLYGRIINEKLYIYKDYKKKNLNKYILLILTLVIKIYIRSL